MSRREISQHIADRSYQNWPAYSSTPLYNRSSLSGLEEDIRTITSVWFDHEKHKSVNQFVRHYPLAYFILSLHDRYAASSRYEMNTLFRVFVLSESTGRITKQR
jgi:hypothetical protein